MRSRTMLAVIHIYNTGELKVVETPPPQLRDGCVLVRNINSLISAGTEKLKIDTGEKSLIGKARTRPDLVQRVIKKARTDGLWKTWQTVSDRLSTPSAMGYSCAGMVVDAEGDVNGLRAGDLVACGGGTANHAEMVCIPKNLVVPVPCGVGMRHAAFATVGAIAMQGVRQAEVRLGERVAVIGLGLIGLLTVQILRASGCSVIGVDLEPDRLERALELGCEQAVLAGDEEIEDRVLLFTDGYGVDAAVITAGTPSNRPIELAGDITREKGRVVVVGAAKMNVPREPFYMKEIDLRLSRSYGPGRYDRMYEDHGRDYPYGYVRFTERRNMLGFLELVESGRVCIDPIITHTFPVRDAEKAYHLVRGERTERYLGILLAYDRPPESIPTRIELNAKPMTGKVRLSVVGAGHYATTHLLPHLKVHPDIALETICTGSGITAVRVAEKFAFRRADADVEAAFETSDAVLIATRHNHHAPYALRALQKGLPLFVEKPLVIRDEELDQVEEAAETFKGSIMVGFNRRFSPAVAAVKDHLGHDRGPCQILIRINAGRVPMDHWIQDPEVGGGRLIGEACHFVDLAVTISEARVKSISAAAVPRQDRSHLLWDDFSLNMRMTDGSVATVMYTSMGDSGLSKEYVEVYAGGKVGIIDDFRAVELWSGGKKERKRWVRQDKGQAQQVSAWVGGLKTGISPIPWPDIINVHRACLGGLRSLQNGATVNLA